MVCHPSSEPRHDADVPPEVALQAVDLVGVAGEGIARRMDAEGEPASGRVGGRRKQAKGQGDGGKCLAHESQIQQARRSDRNVPPEMNPLPAEVS